MTHANKLIGNENTCKLTLKGGKVTTLRRINWEWRAPTGEKHRNLRVLRRLLIGKQVSA